MMLVDGDENESDGFEFADDDDGDDDDDDDDDDDSLTHGTSILMNSDRVHTSVTFNTVNKGLNNPTS